MPKVNEDYPGKELTDDQLKQQVIHQSYVESKEAKPTTEKSNHKFPTEFVELPSKGWLYPEDNPLSSGKVEMKYMTAKEEDILTSQNLIKKGLVIDQLLRSLIVSPINYNDLLVGDKNAIMVAARILGYGADYPVEVQCPECGTKNKVEINLSEIQEKQIDEANSKVARVQQIKKFTLLENEWTDSSGELTPTLKLKRNVIAERYKNEIESMYEEA